MNFMVSFVRMGEVISTDSVCQGDNSHLHGKPTIGYRGRRSGDARGSATYQKNMLS